MSRCFPYPPPGFERSLASIEPIKIRKESEKAERERKKEKKREKKEKKEKARGDKERAESDKHGHKKRRYSELSQSTQKTADSAKAREDDSEQLEKSSLTEEQGGPAAVQSLCDSSDSTQNSNKRSKHEPAAVIRITQGGNGLRIRLPLSRHRDTESPLSSERPCFSGRSDTVPPRQESKAVVRPGQPSSSIDEQPCFSGRTSAAPSVEPLQKTDRVKPVSVELRISSGSSQHPKSVNATDQSADRSKPAASVEPPISSGGASQHQKSLNATDSCRVHRKSHRSGSSSSRDRETRRLYKKLIVEWSPPPLQAAIPEDDDEDWLFSGKTGSSSGRRQQGEGGTTAAGGEDAGLEGALCSWPPRACLLPEVGIYALPYVVPF